jgi:thioredoxin-related protein
MKKIFILSFLVFFSIKFYAQEMIEPGLVKWYTIEQAEELNKKFPRPLYIDMYTDWCGWCKHMMKTTFANQYIANYINSNFYPVRFDAEGKDTVFFQGKRWVSQDTSRKESKHELAIYLMDGRMSFPTIVYLQPDGSKTPIPGYKNVREQEPLMYFFAEEINKTTDYSDFEKNFVMSFATDTMPGRKELTSGKVNWLSMNEAIAANAKKPKKFYIDVYGSMYVKSRVMDSTTYQNHQVAELLNNQFYPVHFNAASQEKVNFQGKEFVNKGSGAFSLHEFAAYVMGNKIAFSSILFLDEKLNPITKIDGYFSPKRLKSILKYFGSDIYKNQTWEEYLKQNPE